MVGSPALALLPDTLAAAPMRLALVGVMLVCIFGVAGAALSVGKRAQSARSAKDLSALTGSSTGAQLGGDGSISGDWWATTAASDQADVDSAHPQSWQNAFLGADAPVQERPAPAPTYGRTREITVEPIPVPPVVAPLAPAPSVPAPVPPVSPAPVAEAEPTAVEPVAYVAPVEPAAYIAPVEPAALPSPETAAPVTASDTAPTRTDIAYSPAPPAGVSTFAPVSLDGPAVIESADTWGVGETGDDDAVSATWWQNAVADERL
jgi:hypothetical protein